MSGNLEMAVAWRCNQDKLLFTGGESNPFPPHQYDCSSITYARVLNAEGKTREALEWLERLFVIAESFHKADREIEILILRAMIYLSGGNTSSAWESIEQVLVTLEPQSYLQVFIDEGYSMETLLKWGLEHKKSLDERIERYIENLLQTMRLEKKVKSQAREKTPQTGFIPLSPDDLLVPLTLREHEVLKLMAGGLSNKQIAGKMVLSVGTVKAHIHQILEKLDVHTRSSAIIRARELSLLS